jgi:PAS domain-containing protein
MRESHDILLLRNGMTVEQRSVPQLVQGRPAGRVYTFRDITSDIQNQADLRLAARVFESSLDAVFIADRRNAILRINPACENFSGHPPTGWLVNPSPRCSPGKGPERLPVRVQQGWLQNGFWEGELHLRQRDGGDCSVHLSWVVLRDAGEVTRKA